MSSHRTRLKRVALLYYAMAFVLGVIGLTLTISNWDTAYYQFLKDFAGPTATVIAAGAAAVITLHFGRTQAQIAQQQADLAAVRLQHDLFDRRFEIYEAARTLLIDILKSGNISNEKLGNYIRSTEKAVFVFDQDITDYLEVLRVRAIQLQEANAMIADPTIMISSDSRPAPQRKTEIATWFYSQFDVLISKFKPFLALDRNTASHAPPPNSWK
jgi:hypothetical protein